ncbi:signal recognition particle receptor subunit beta isoform X1 [Polypterus senegalus]|uniref:signal recognition particle receptor subunit beta isoform X1 n=1 Tax=Polypterus senegalus TaxID=55291 RepID=UPI0019649AE2|nr:signal recognition particle receptor subunit beta isoform X1 [Polypterus senegalus]
MESTLFQPYLDIFRQELQAQNPAILGVLFALFVVGFTIIIMKIVWSKKITRRAVLLIGLCESGKTLLFIRLISGKFKHTQTSITDSSASYRITGDKNSTLTLIDIPGHESLRLQFLEKFKSAARAIIFVVDSAIFQKELRDVAELLYIVLTDDIIEKNGIALAVACNKQDVVMSKSSKLIRQQLEKELNTLRVTRSAALSSLDNSTGVGNMYLGKKGKDFEFSQLPFKVDFIECSARGSKEDSEPDIRELEKWLHGIV